MKRIIIAFTIVLGTLTSCSMKEQTEIATNTNEVRFYACNADWNSTKTALQAQGAIYWLPKDEISVFYGENLSARFISNNNDPSAQAVFQGELEGFTYHEGSTTFSAVYPYREDNLFDGELFTLSIPREQSAVPGSFADDLFVSIAQTSDFTLQFFNVCGGIKFCITEPGVKRVTFSGNGGEAVAGTFRAGLNEAGLPSIHDIVVPETSISLTSPDGSAFQTGTWYYLAALPTVLEKGYKITLEKEDGTSTVKRSSRPVTIKRSIWGVLENLDKGLTYEIRVPDNEIWYTTIDGEIIEPDYIYEDYTNVYDNGMGRLIFEKELTEISGMAFQDQDRLETISIPESVTIIQGYAFNQDENLKAIDMPGVEVISTRAFCGSGLSGILDLPETLREIKEGAFESCSNLTEIIIPKNVTTIGENAFLNGSFTKLVLMPVIPPTITGTHYAPFTLEGRDDLWERKCLICVPEESLDAYQTDSRWRDLNAYLTVEGKMPQECYYTSTDYSRDGEVIVLEKATVGKGVDLVFLGDGYVDRDLEPGGKFEQRVRTEVEHLFGYEPYKSFRNRFNIVLVNVVSKNEVFFSPFGAERTFSYDLPNNPLYSPIFEKCEEYANKVSTTAICAAILLNKFPDRDGGVCYYTSYHPRRSFAFCPNVHDYEEDRLNDHRLFTHEFGGHGFGLLADEYGGVGLTFVEDSRESLDQAWTLNSFGANIDWRNDPQTVRWNRFLADSRYSKEALGVYEGAYAFDFGIYRCSEESVMNGTGGHEIAPKHPMWFNAPSREQIYKQIMLYSEGEEWVYDYETFAELDAPGREQAATLYQEYLRIYDEWLKEFGPSEAPHKERNRVTCQSPQFILSARP